MKYLPRRDVDLKYELPEEPWLCASHVAVYNSLNTSKDYLLFKHSSQSLRIFQSL